MSMNLTKFEGGSNAEDLLYVGFNQDYGCFAVGTNSGFSIHNCSDTYRETLTRDFKSGIGIVAMLHRCNILAIIGAGKNPRFPLDKVMLWDDYQKRCIGELSFRSEVKQVKLRRDRVVVVLQNKIYVYNFANLKLLDHIETCNNPKGLCELSSSATSTVLAFPALMRGHVRVELYDIRKTNFISAHERDLACLALNANGSRLATASDTGTLIRIFDTHTATQLQELRRGGTGAEIYSLCFNPDSSMVATTSNHSTCHVFKLNEKATVAGGAAAASATEESKTSARTAAAPATTATATTTASGSAAASGAAATSSAAAAGAGGDTTNTKSTLSRFSGYLPKYFSSEWSFAKCKAPDGVRSICAFGSDPNTIILLGADGSFSRFKIAEGGGDAKRIEYARFAGTEPDEADA